MRLWGRVALGLLWPVLTAPVFVVLTVAGFWLLGCQSPTIGGGAGRENDPCRDGEWAALLSAVVCLALWAWSSQRVWRWAQR